MKTYSVKTYGPEQEEFHGSLASFLNRFAKEGYEVVSVWRNTDGTYGVVLSKG